MKKYTFEFEVETGFDCSLPEIVVKEGENAVAAFVDLKILREDFGELYYDKHSKPDILTRKDGTAYAHVRIHGTYLTTAAGFTKEDCRDKAKAAFESADFGSLCKKSDGRNIVIDETFSGKIIAETEEVLNCDRLSALIANSISQMNSRNSQIGMSIADRFIAQNIDKSGMTIDVKINDPVEGTIDFDLYKGVERNADKVFVPAEDDFPPDENFFLHRSNVPDYIFSEITEKISQGELNSSKEIDRPINNAYIQKIITMSEKDVVFFADSLAEKNYTLALTKQDKNITIEIVDRDNGKRILGCTKPVQLTDIPRRIKFSALAKNDYIPFVYESTLPDEGTFTTTIKRAIMQDYLEYMFIKEWKDEVHVDINKNLSFKITADIEKNTFTAYREKGRIEADNEETIIGSRTKEPVQQDLTSSSLREIVDFIFEDKFRVRQHVLTHNMPKLIGLVKTQHPSQSPKKAAPKHEHER